MNFNDLKIKNKFISVLTIIAVLVIIMMGLSYFSFMKMSNMMEEFSNVQYVNTKAQMDMRKDIQTINKRILLAIYEPGENPVADQRADFVDRFDGMKKNIDTIGRTLGNPELINELNEKFTALQNDSNTILDMLDKGDRQGAIHFYDNGFNKKTSEEFVSALSAVGKLSDQQASAKITSAGVLRTTVSITLAITFIAVMAVSIAVFVYLANYITKSVSLANHAMASVSHGDFGFEIDKKLIHKDEFGEMLTSIDDTMKTLNTLVADMSHILGQMAKGNFAEKLQHPEVYVGDTSPIKAGFEQISKNLAGIFANMNQVAAQVKTGSEQIANGSMALSQGATEQASTLEELSAPISTLNDKVRENAKAAINVENFSADVADKITKENEQMLRVQDAMKEIEAKSNQIENIIKAIDDIAFQTNILALNAAVEAARAGAAGKGFAVVADEVRNLAGKSADAAAETSTLIEAAINAINNGSKMVVSAVASLNEVKDNSVKSKELVAAIAEEMQREAQSISEITTGLEQISQVVQQNSATAEESSASSSELNDHASVLKNMVDRINY